MEQLCLQNYGVSQMETREMKTVDGGWIRIAIAAIALAIVILNTDWDKAADDFKRGYNAE